VTEPQQAREVGEAVESQQVREVGEAVESHRVREVAESFGADAARYDRARPSYPPALVDWIVAGQHSAGQQGVSLLDVGCGTGITSRLFQAAGCRVLGIDPDPRMADLARAGGIEVEVATFEDWDPAGRVFDAVTAGQAWHWVDPVAGAAKAAQALRPGGRLTLFWNSCLPPAGLNEALGAVLNQVMPNAPRGAGLPGPDVYARGCERAADGMARAGGFGPAQQARFDWERPYTRDEWLDAVPTFGGIGGRLPAATLAELTAGIGAAIDAVGGSFVMGYATLAVTATRA
jgi:SAM-dependent methyltransferase